MTPAAKALGAPFKPYFGLSGLGCLPDLFVIRSAAEASAVRPGSRTKVSVPLVPPQNRHPEAASPYCRLHFSCL